MKCVPVHHGIPAVLHRDEPWLHRHSENGALVIYELFNYTFKVGKKAKIRNRYNQVPHLTQNTVSPISQLSRVFSLLMWMKTSVGPDQLASSEAS